VRETLARAEAGAQPPQRTRQPENVISRDCRRLRSLLAGLGRPRRMNLRFVRESLWNLAPAREARGDASDRGMRPTLSKRTTFQALDTGANPR